MWLPGDTELALEWQRQQARERTAECPGCHQPRDKAFAVEHEQDWTAEARRCYACAAVGRVADEMAEASREGGNLHGVSFISVWDPRG